MRQKLTLAASIVVIFTVITGMNAFAGRTIRPDTATTTTPTTTAVVTPSASTSSWYGVNVKDYGAKGDGVTDDSQAFIQAISYAESQSVYNTSVSFNRSGRVKIYVPAGAYVVKQPEALMRGTYTVRTSGLVIEGAGRGITQILYRPATTGTYLLNNNDGWLHLTIRDIEFNSDNIANNFMRSYSTGGAQNYSFERVKWSGKWNYTFNLVGTNTNSEFTWFHCDWSGTVNKGVYVGASTGSDQFVNYNFFATNFEVDGGDFLHFEKGGSINVWGGSFITGANGGTFFKLVGNTHAMGAQRLLVSGARVEHRTSASKLIDSSWGWGSITFLNSDFYVEGFVAGSDKWVTAVFNAGNERMPVIKFDNCQLMGVHEYHYSSGSYSYPHNIIYENCFLGHDKPEQLISFVSNDGINDGGRPVIHFRNSQGKLGRTVYDMDYGFSTATVGETTKKIVSIKNAQGNFPYNASPTVTVTLPINAIITKVILYSPSGAVTTTSPAVFTVRTNELTPTVLAKVDTTGVSAHSAGFNLQKDMFFVADTDAKRTITLEAGSIVSQSNGKAYCLIEYIG